jgi:TPP-dependent pyruvate/acetoin dehydrogenase alpha subunit
MPYTQVFLPPDVSKLPEDVLLKLYQQMLLIRRFEERVSDLFAKGKVPGFVHVYIGEEAVAVGACSALNSNDYITSTHRGHGHTLAKGGDVNKAMAELFGKATGYCKGKGGSMHITDMQIGMLGANGIVAGGLPIALGAAYGVSKIYMTDQVVVAFFGDGATNEGPFHEVCNIAAAWDLPLILVCENNLYGVGTRLGSVAAKEDIAPRAVAYGIESEIVDGNNVIAVRAAVEQAVERARQGQGPSFIECKTWRHRGHFEGESVVYRNEDEHNYWMERDPIRLLGDALIQNSIVSKAKLEELDAMIETEIDAAVQFAEESPFPLPEDALDDVYSKPDVR